MDSESGYELHCTLSYGDIYGQILIWLLIIFLSLATGLALIAAEHPVAGIIMIGMVFVLSLPFLLFAFVTTLNNHLVLDPRSPK